MAVGWRILRSGVGEDGRSFLRVVRLIKQLLWLSVGMKVGGGVGIGALGWEYSEPGWALAIVGCLCLLLGEFGLIFWRLYPLERRFRGIELGVWRYVGMRLGFVFEVLAPVVAIAFMALTVLYTTRGGYRDAGGRGILWAGAMGMAGTALAVLYYRRRLVLPVRPVLLPESLMAEAQRMAREVGVSLREVIVLDGCRAKLANAFALPGGRIAITDYLLGHLEPQEVLAVLAHEVAHLAQRRRLVRLWGYLLGIAVGLTVGLAPFWQRLPDWAGVVLMAVLGLGMSVPLVILRARHEREADTFAVSVCGVEALRTALLKSAQLNPRHAHERTDALHPSLQERLRYLRRFERNP